MCLAPQHINRALRQIQLTDHTAFDHLMFGGTEYDSNSLGDYLGGTLRIGIKLAGSPASPRLQEPAQILETARHEVFHAAAAQVQLASSWEWRVGLDDGQGDG